MEIENTLTIQELTDLRYIHDLEKDSGQPVDAREVDKIIGRPVTHRLTELGLLRPAGGIGWVRVTDEGAQIAAAVMRGEAA